jgi:hypothetical protein
MSHYLILTESGLATLKIRYYIYGIFLIRLYIYIYSRKYVDRFVWCSFIRVNVIYGK